MTGALFLLRALQVGLRLSDLDELEEGQVADIIIESGNDSAEYDFVATQEDMDAFAKG